MKKGILFLLIVSTVNANAQSLKDLLYGGKLKSDTGSLIKKTDDLSSKIDTSRKKPVEPVKTKLTTAAKDSSVKTTTVQSDTTAIATAIDGTGKMDNNTATKENTRLWKEFMDSFITTLKEEVLTSKKIKTGIYYVLLDYEIGPDGQVTVNGVYPSPENSTLEKEIKERLMLLAPTLHPLMGTNGKPRKAIKKYNFTLTKS